MWEDKSLSHLSLRQETIGKKRMQVKQTRLTLANINLNLIGLTPKKKLLLFDTINPKLLEMEKNATLNETPHV